MSKYQPLQAFLSNRSDSELPMSFQEIEALIGAPLPPAALKHRPWWSNNASNHVHSRAWLEAGYRTSRVNMASRKLVFERAAPTVSGAGWIAALQAQLGGTVQVAPGWDLTEPTGEVWDAER
jgi:hypothetical protein